MPALPPPLLAFVRAAVFGGARVCLVVALHLGFLGGAVGWAQAPAATPVTGAPSETLPIRPAP